MIGGRGGMGCGRIRMSSQMISPPAWAGNSIAKKASTNALQVKFLFMMR